MEVRKKYLLGVVASIVVGMVLGLQGFAASTTPSPNAGTGFSALTGSGGLPPHHLKLKTVAYALRAVADRVLIPEASRIGLGYLIIGVQLDEPHLVTTDTGVTWRDWGILFVISDLPFVNGISLNTDFSGHWIVVMESVSPDILNSHDNAMSYMAPQQICHTDNNGTQQTCTDVTTSTSDKQLIQIRNTWLVVDPTEPNADFSIDGINRGIHISGDMSYEQMLALADSVIP